MMNNFIALIVITTLNISNFFSFIDAEVFAQDQNILEGVSWLANSQHEDGSWGSSSTAFRDTCVVIETLLNLNFEGTSTLKGLTRIEETNTITTDYSSRKILVLAKSGTETDSLTEVLSSYQNANGGWGYKGGYNISNPFDTALVLESFDIAGYNCNGVADEACRWLQGKQSSDGGWRMVDEDESFVYSTALAVLALIKRGEETRGNVKQALAWLQSQQNTDGGFGDDVSTVSNYR